MPFMVTFLDMCTTLISIILYSCWPEAVNMMCVCVCLFVCVCVCVN